MPRTYDCITRTYSKSKYHQEEHMDCIICSDQVGFKLTLVNCQANQAHLPQVCFTGPSSQILVDSLHWVTFFLCWSAIPHTLPSGQLLKIFLHKICKAHLGLCLLLPLQTLPTTLTRAFAPSGSLGQQSILFPLSIPCPHEAIGREQISSLPSATLQLPLKSTFGLKNVLRTNINFIKSNFLTSSISTRLGT